MCTLLAQSERPESLLKTCRATCAMLYKICDMPDPFDLYDVQKFMLAAIKTGSKKPMQKSSAMPITPFRDLFLNWPENDSLSLKQLRLKCITLMALTCMLRPSDIAPKGVVLNTEATLIEHMVFSVEHLVFKDDGSVNIVFHGIKNDLDRKGFVITLPPADEAKLDPVRCLHMYIQKTAQHRKSPKDAVFISLTAPYGPLSNITIAKVMQEAINLAGLGGQGFSAKSFRPTGGTVAIDVGCDPEIARKIGRWKSSEVFFEHYVHSKPSLEYTSKLLSAK